MEAYVYMVTDGRGKRTYVGYTVNVERRIRQHAGELKHGARTTSKFQGGVHYAVIVGPFPSKRMALSLEATWKRTRARGIRARCLKLAHLLNHPRPHWKPLCGGCWPPPNLKVQIRHRLVDQTVFQGQEVVMNI